MQDHSSEFDPISAGGGHFFIGYVEAIDGTGGEIAETAVTRAEIDRLVRHYLDEVADIMALTLQFNEIGSTDASFVRYAWARVANFIEAGAITQKRHDEIWEQLVKKYALNEFNDVGNNGSTETE